MRPVPWRNILFEISKRLIVGEYRLNPNHRGTPHKENTYTQRKDNKVINIDKFVDWLLEEFI